MGCYINRKKALDALGNRIDIYNSVIRKFLEKYDGFSDKLLELLNHQDRKGLYIEVHSLKTVAGTIGISRLYEIAREVESIVSNEEFSMESIGITSLSDELTLSIETLKRLEPQVDAPVKAFPETSGLKFGKEVDYANTSMHLKYLEDQIRTFNPVNLSCMNKALKSNIWPEAIEQELKKIETNINNYNFVNALKITVSAKNKLYSE